MFFVYLCYNFLMCICMIKLCVYMLYFNEKDKWKNPKHDGYYMLDHTENRFC